MPILSTAGQTLERLQKLADEQSNERSREMLLAFKRHWGAEVAGDLDAAMAELPENSYFGLRGALAGGSPFEVQTAAEHRAVYQRMLDINLNPGGALSDERFAFADWGMMMEAIYSNVIYGAMLANVGDYGPQDLYLVHIPMVMICYFSSDGKMLGKRDYMADPLSIEPADRRLLEQLVKT
jgi:hypothetical protein